MRPVHAGQHQGGADGADRLAEALVLVTGKHVGDLVALAVLDQRQDAQHRQVEFGLDVLGALEGVVEHLQQ
ncbi:hypothetical protein D3C78_774150 [compost metagenome]